MNNYYVNESGYYGEFGGAYIPETLNHVMKELTDNYLDIIQSPEFKAEYDELLRHYVGRPSPLYLSKHLSEKHGCKIYLKREDLNHTGAHKINNTIGQILLAKKLGKNRIICETGAGQHGVATATVCALMQMECVVYMGKVDVERQAPNVKKMQMLGAEVVAATSGSMALADAVNEALAEWSQNPDETHYIIGSVVGPHPYPDMVARLQAVISEEIKKQLIEQESREAPDYLIACVGGGSNAAGTIYHYLDNDDVKLVFAEAAGKGIDTPQTAATMSIGTTGVIHGFKTLLMQDENGQPLDSYSISAGLNYPGVGPLYAHLSETKRAQVVAINDDEALAALDKLTFKPDDVVVLTLSGRGDKDLDTYLKHMG